MRLPPETRKRLLAELGALKHLMRSEQEIRYTAQKNGTVRRADVRQLRADFERPGITGQPTPTERELILLVTAND